MQSPRRRAAAPRRHLEQRPQMPADGERAAGRHGAQALQTRAAQQLQQQGLGLILGMMGGQQAFAALEARARAPRSAPRAPPPRCETPAPHTRGPQHAERDIEPAAQGRAGLAQRRGHRLQAMVHVQRAQRQTAHAPRMAVSVPGLRERGQQAGRIAAAAQRDDEARRARRAGAPRAPRAARPRRSSCRRISRRGTRRIRASGPAAHPAACVIGCLQSSAKCLIMLCLRVSAIACGSRCAPPCGSFSTSSTRPSFFSRSAVPPIASAEISFFSVLFHRIEAQLSGEITEYTLNCSITSRSHTPMASAPPEPPSPITTRQDRAPRDATSRTDCARWPRSGRAPPSRSRDRRPAYR